MYNPTYAATIEKQHDNDVTKVANSSSVGRVMPTSLRRRFPPPGAGQNNHAMLRALWIFAFGSGVGSAYGWQVTGVRLS